MIKKTLSIAAQIVIPIAVAFAIGVAFGEPAHAAQKHIGYVEQGNIATDRYEEYRLRSTVQSFMPQTFFGNYVNKWTQRFPQGGMFGNIPQLRLGPAADPNRCGNPNSRYGRC